MVLNGAPHMFGTLPLCAIYVLRMARRYQAGIQHRQAAMKADRREISGGSHQA